VLGKSWIHAFGIRLILFTEVAMHNCRWVQSTLNSIQKSQGPQATFNVSNSLVATERRLEDTTRFVTATTAAQRRCYDEWLLDSMLRAGITALRRADGYTALARLVRRIPPLLSFSLRCCSRSSRTNLTLLAARPSGALRSSLAIDRPPWQQAGRALARRRRPIRPSHPFSRTGRRGGAGTPARRSRRHL
jgi:hypothetical protein